MKIVHVTLAALLAAGASALAGSSTVNYNSTGSSPFATTTDASLNNYSRQTIWDYSAAANGAGVGTDHGLLVAPSTAATWGLGATGAAVPANSAYVSGDAVSSEPSKATTGNLTGVFLDLAGKQVISPYANRENMARGAAALSGTSATTILAASGSASLKEYITDLTCTRNDAGTTAVSVTFNDSASTVVDLPNNGGGGGYAHTYNVPLVVAANTALTGTAGGLITTIHCSATGFYGY